MLEIYAYKWLDDLTIDFGDSVWTPGLNMVISNTTTTMQILYINCNVEFNNIVTLPVGNYKVSVYATFSDSAINNNTKTNWLKNNFSKPSWSKVDRSWTTWHNAGTVHAKGASIFQTLCCKSISYSFCKR